MAIKPSRGCLIVTPVSTEEKRANSAIILLEDTREKLANHQMLVVSVGADEVCEEPEDCGQQHIEAPREAIGLFFGRSPLLNSVIDASERIHPTDKRIKPDAWVLVKPRSLVEVSAQDKLYSCRISEVVGVFVEALTDSAA
jgi:hypothetical protein